MPTDRDRFARVLDKRFASRVSYAIEAAEPDAVRRLCEYILEREHEADPTVAAFFQDAHRVLSRPAMNLFRDGNPDDERIRLRATMSEPATRLAYAYEDVLNGRHPDLASADAARCVGWVAGQIATVPAWEHLRANFALIERTAVDELTRMICQKYLGIGEAPARVAQPALLDFNAATIPLLR
jgi:hypothetical protein